MGIAIAVRCPPPSPAGVRRVHGAGGGGGGAGGGGAGPPAGAGGPAGRGVLLRRRGHGAPRHQQGAGVPVVGSMLFISNPSSQTYDVGHISLIHA